MAGSTCTSPASAMVRRQFIVFSTVLLFLANSHYFLADAGASHLPGVIGTLLPRNNRHAWRNLKSTAAENVGVSAVVASCRMSSRTTRGTNLRSRRIVASNDDVTTTLSRQEVDALIAMKAAITSDPLRALENWRANDSSVCGWAGVVCSPRQPKHLIAVNLGDRQLVGNLSSALEELGKFPFIQRLDLSNNVFSGSIPGAALANFSNLSYFNISYNEVTGTIPFLLGELVNLEALDLQENNITGEIPATLGNCSLLRVLDLGSNLLEGEIPPAFGRLSHLEFLNLAAKPLPNIGKFSTRPAGFNSFSGSISPEMGNCSSLTHLDTSYNSNLGGELPPELKSLKSLRQLGLALCYFQGTLPSWLGNFTGLNELRLSYNQFDGEIPDVLGQLRNLSGLALGGNKLSGVIPVTITNCTRLIELGFEENSLAGNIPPQLGQLKILEVLFLGDNNFTGVIPPDIANCSSLTELAMGFNPLDPQIISPWIGSFGFLEYLYLANLNLQGEVPEEIGKLSNLDSLLLFDNNLSGLIPSSLANCTLLGVLDLGGNKIVGQFPSEIGQLINIYYFGFSNCFLKGSLPTFIANFTLLEIIEVEYNSLDGTIDGTEFGRLSELQRFHVEGNHFDGLIPVTLSNCSNLQDVDLSQNRLTGEIPPSLGNLTKLNSLSLATNKIRGSVPVDILRSSELVTLALEFNNLQGNIPVNIGQLSFLEDLRLANNNFVGVVPSSLGNCSNMRNLDLSYNRLSGNVPNDLFPKMALLTSLNLSHNSFSGSWLQQFSRLTSIQIINISANNISGSIPSSLGSCKDLEKLDISINNLTGVIPPSLGLLPALAFLNVSYNNLQGPIPDSGVFENNLTSTSFMGNPGLCGTILGPHRGCLASNSSSRSCEGFHCKRLWIPTTCAGAGFVFIVAAVICWVSTVREAKKRNNSRHLIVNFGVHDHIRLSEKDVLRTIDGGGLGGVDNVVGVGAKSVVYKMVLPGGEMVAIKVLASHGDDKNVDNSHGDSQFLHEVHILAKLRHRNIVKVLGVCSNLNVKAIILEYMPQGSLHKHLYPPEGGICELKWQTRLNIAFGTAEGIMYLHHGFPEPLIHRDLKPNNILLDVNMEPKVGDFGISKFANPTGEGEATASKVCGTIGYMPPEYATGTSISTRGDVYSYGIVLLELLTRKSPTSPENFDPDRDLRGWVMELFQESPMELLDSTLFQESATDSVKKEQMMLLVRLALFCTRQKPQSRPSMSDVLAMLAQIKEVGSVPITPRTIEELANESAIWKAQDPNDASLPSFSESADE